MQRLLQFSGALILSTLVLWCLNTLTRPSMNSSCLSVEDLVSHVPFHRDLQDFIDTFEGPKEQQIIKVRSTTPVRVIQSLCFEKLNASCIELHEENNNAKISPLTGLFLNNLRSKTS